MFNQEFDRSLGLMLESNKNNREKIINFIKLIPSELFEQLNIQLDRYREYEECDIDILEREDICLYGECLDKLNEKYSFIVDMIQNSLTISRSIPCGDSFRNVFEITLYARSSYNNVTEFGKQLLGNVNDYVEDSITEYELNDMLFGKMVVYSENGGFKRYKRVNINEISDDIRIDDLSSQRGISRVRKNR